MRLGSYYSTTLLWTLVSFAPIACKSQTASTGGLSSVSQTCLAAAKSQLGPGAIVLRCGNLSNRGKLEVLAAVKLTTVSPPKYCTPVSRFAIFSLQDATRTVEVDGAKQIKNPEGYIATDYIDDSPDLPSYCLQAAAQRSDGTSGFTVFLNYFGARGEIEGSSTEISWNDKVDRYQEFTEVEGFRPEVKTPPHIRTRRSKK